MKDVDGHINKNHCSSIADIFLLTILYVLLISRLSSDPISLNTIRMKY